MTDNVSLERESIENKVSEKYEIDFFRKFHIFIHLYKYSVSIWFAEMSDLKSHKPPLQLKCQRCSRVWYYRGSNPYYASCSFCKCSVNVRKNRVQVDSLVAASNQPEPPKKVICND